MKITPIKTPIVRPSDNLYQIIADNIKKLPEKSVLIITSKIIAYCQNRIIKKSNFDNKNEKHQLVIKEADLWLDPSKSQYQTMLTIKNNILAVNAGIDESNSLTGDYILWPDNLQTVANQVWSYLKNTYQLRQVGVLITDSKTMPLKWGVTGTALACCGFDYLNDYRRQKDIFGRALKMTQINVAEALAAAAVLEMGESDQQTPLAIAQNIKLINFTERPPSKLKLKQLKIKLEEDVYYPVLKHAPWQKGQSGRS